jgi:hypothetical protein
MEQHPIPQNISSYQFHLVGDMTLKQFFQLAGGILIGFIFYSTPIIGIIKWPFAILSVILGIGLAFFPLEERPLERWIFAFFRAIYAPTEYYWQKTVNPEKFFQEEAPVPISPPTPSTVQQAALKTYLSGTQKPSGPFSKLEATEQNFLATLSGVFASFKSAPPVTPISTPTNEPKKELRIPVIEPVRIVQPQKGRVVVEEKPKVVVSSPQITPQAVAPVIAGDEMISTRQAVFSVDAAPPSPPTLPNVIVGQVVDENRRIVDGAIMEIRDEGGRPVRALRSNRLGHFITVTPLDVGRYDIFAEKEGFRFTPVSFDATSAIIPPILVQGQKLATGPLPDLNLNPMQTKPVKPAYVI